MWDYFSWLEYDSYKFEVGGSNPSSHTKRVRDFPESRGVMNLVGPPPMQY